MARFDTESCYQVLPGFYARDLSSCGQKGPLGLPFGETGRASLYPVPARTAAHILRTHTARRPPYSLSSQTWHSERMEERYTLRWCIIRSMMNMNRASFMWRKKCLHLDSHWKVSSQRSVLAFWHSIQL